MQTGKPAECAGFDHGDAVSIQIPEYNEKTITGDLQVIETGQPAEYVSFDHGEVIRRQIPGTLRQLQLQIYNNLSLVSPVNVPAKTTVRALKPRCLFIVSVGDTNIDLDATTHIHTKDAMKSSDEGDRKDTRNRKDRPCAIMGYLCKII